MGRTWVHPYPSRLSGVGGQDYGILGIGQQPQRQGLRAFASGKPPPHPRCPGPGAACGTAPVMSQDGQDQPAQQAQPARPRQVVVWQHDQARLQHDVIGLGDVQSDTPYGRLLVRSLTRAQLGLSLMCLALAVAVVASLPVLAALWPGARRITVAGLPLTLVVLGAGIYPVLMAIRWVYNHQARQLEARFIDLIDPADRRLDG